MDPADNLRGNLAELPLFVGPQIAILIRHVRPVFFPIWLPLEMFSIFHSGFLRSSGCAVGLIVLALSAANVGMAAEEQAVPSETRQPGFDPVRLADTLQSARELPSLQSILVARDGQMVLSEGFHGHDVDEPVNIKSLSKTVLSALVGIAIDKGVFSHVDQLIAPLLADSMPKGADPRVSEITIDNLLAMRAGLEATSGDNYGAWISSGNWVRSALSQPFRVEPGGEMIYSTGNSHLLSAALTRASGRSTADLADDWLGDPLGIDVPPWERDPQGIFLGGNNMAMSAEALLRFGEMYRNGGLHGGERILSQDWIDASWAPQGTSLHSGDRYGYGWFITEMRGQAVYYGWGYGGQMLYVIPGLQMTVVMISDSNAPSGSNGYVSSLHALVSDRLIPAAIAAGSPPS